MGLKPQLFLEELAWLYFWSHKEKAKCSKKTHNISSL
jgi:hypothetical protein